MLDRYGRGQGLALDLASGGGRHSRLLASLGYEVVAVDRNADLASLYDEMVVRFQALDLEQATFPLADVQAEVVVVSNYLYRPHLQAVSRLVKPGGIWVYETFGQGNERFGKPSNPDFLMAPSELSDRFQSDFETLETFFGEVSEPSPAIRARYCGRRRG